jgi:hypothetical protein
MRHLSETRATRATLAAIAWLAVAAGACASFTSAGSVAAPDASTDAAMTLDAPSESGSADADGDTGVVAADADAGHGDAAPDGKAPCKAFQEACTPQSGCCAGYICAQNGSCETL